MATANKIATKGFCNTIKNQTFTSGTAKCITASEASAAGFSHNGTSPSYKCVKETNISVRNRTFVAKDLTPFIGNYVNDEYLADGQGSNYRRRFGLGTVVMLDNITGRLKLFAFTQLSDVHDMTGGDGFKEYDGERFTPLGIVVGVPSTEYSYRNTYLYGTGRDLTNQTAEITVMSLLNHQGNFGLKQHMVNAPAYSQWMRNNRNNFEALSASVGVPSISIYNPIEACSFIDTSGHVYFHNDTAQARHSIFAMYKNASGNCLATHISQYDQDSLNLTSNQARAIGSYAAGLRYPAPLCTSTYSPIPTSNSTTAVFTKSGIARVLPFNSAHYDLRCGGTSAETYDVCKIRDFYVSSGYTDIIDGVPWSSLYNKASLFATGIPHRLLRSPYTDGGTSFNESKNQLAGSNRGLLFKSTDFKIYNQHVGQLLNTADDGATFVLPTGASYEAFLRDNGLSYWSTTGLETIVNAYTSGNGIVYTPSLYELFKLVARCRFIWTNILSLAQYFDPELNVSRIDGKGVAQASIASCELDESIVTDFGYRTAMNELLLAGDLTVIGSQANSSVGGTSGTRAKYIGRMCVGLPSIITPTTTTAPASQTIMPPVLYTGPILWTNVNFNSNLHYSCPNLIPFIRIPVDYSQGLNLNLIWNMARVV